MEEQNPPTFTTLFEQLQQTHNDTLAEALAKAVMSGHPLPASMGEPIVHLQKAYLSLSSRTDMQSGLAKSIRGYFNRDNIELFKKTLATTSTEELNPHLITSLCTSLNLTVHQTYLIEAKIVEGKVFWRSIDPTTGKIISDGLKPKKESTSIFEYDPATCFRMTPKQFKEEFKPAGKCDVAITKEAFVNRLLQIQTGVRHQIFENIWDKLVETRILTSEGKLSESYLDPQTRKLPEEVRCGSSVTLGEIAKTLTSIRPTQTGDVNLKGKLAFHEVAIDGRSVLTNTGVFEFVPFPPQKELETLHTVTHSGTTPTTPDKWPAMAVTLDEANLSFDERLASRTTLKAVGEERKLFRESTKQLCAFWQGNSVLKAKTDAAITQQIQSIVLKR